MARWRAPRAPLDGLGRRLGAPLDRATVDGVLSALRGARWQRTGPVAAAGAIVATLPLPHGATTIALGIGQPLAGTEQTWLVRDGRAFVVDDWVARALAVAPWQLHERHPLAAIDDAPRATITFAGELPIVIEAHARRADTWLEPTAVAAFETAARQLAIVGPPAPTNASLAASLTIELPATKLVVLGPCASPPATTQIAGSVAGCVDRAALETLVAAARTLAGPLDPIRDRRLPPRRPRRPPPRSRSARPAASSSTSPPRTSSSRARPGTPRTLDPAELAKLYAALAAPGDLGAVAPLPTAHPVTTITVGPVAIALFAPDMVVRDSALRIDPAAFAILARPASAYLDRALWAEDPITVVRLAIDRHELVRGAVLGEWSRDGAPAKPDPAAEAYVALLAHARAIDGRPAAPPTAAHHVVASTILTPANSTTSHALDVGAPTATACPAHVDAIGEHRPAARVLRPAALISWTRAVFLALVVLVLTSTTTAASADGNFAVGDAAGLNLTTPYADLTFARRFARAPHVELYLDAGYDRPISYFAFYTGGLGLRTTLTTFGTDELALFHQALAGFAISESGRGPVQNRDLPQRLLGPVFTQGLGLEYRFAPCWSAAATVSTGYPVPPLRRGDPMALLSRRLLVFALPLTACGTMEVYFAQDVVDEHTDLDYVSPPTNPRQRLDLYLPRGIRDYPVAVFVHGGYWIHQAKDYAQPVTRLYRNAGIALARRGIGTAVIDYRLVPRRHVRRRIRRRPRVDRADGSSTSPITAATRDAHGHRRPLRRRPHDRARRAARGPARRRRHRHVRDPRLRPALADPRSPPEPGPGRSVDRSDDHRRGVRRRPRHVLAGDLLPGHDEAAAVRVRRPMDEPFIVDELRPGPWPRQSTRPAGRYFQIRRAGPGDRKAHSAFARPGRLSQIDDRAAS